MDSSIVELNVFGKKKMFPKICSKITVESKISYPSTPKRSKYTIFTLLSRVCNSFLLANFLGIISRTRSYFTSVRVKYPTTSKIERLSSDRYEIVLISTRTFLSSISNIKSGRKISFLRSTSSNSKKELFLTAFLNTFSKAWCEILWDNFGR